MFKSFTLQWLEKKLVTTKDKNKINNNTTNKITCEW